jgi:hypothetical protein
LSLFSKKNLPAWIYWSYFVAFIVVGAAASEYRLAKYAMMLLIAPIPIAFTILAILAYGEWLFMIIGVWKTDREEFSNRMFIGIGKAFAGFAFLASLGGLLWALEQPNHWALLAAIAVLLCFVALSIVSLLFYRFYRHWKTRNESLS